jgi:hypothetical protein
VFIRVHPWFNGDFGFVRTEGRFRVRSLLRCFGLAAGAGYELGNPDAPGNRLFRDVRHRGIFCARRPEIETTVELARAITPRIRTESNLTWINSSEKLWACPFWHPKTAKAWTT